MVHAFGRTTSILSLWALLACGGGESSDMEFGPVDGRDLPPADTGRVAAGDTAPDFTLPAFRGGSVTLSRFRGTRPVILVFYRGHW